jgi:hypothetical protein
MVMTNGGTPTPLEQITVRVAPLKLAVQPAGGAVAAKVTVPVKPVVVQFDVIGVPASCVKVLGEQVMVGVGVVVTTTSTVRDRVLGAVPVVPVTVTVNPVAGNGLQLTERTAPLMDAEQLAGAGPAVKVTVPVNPLILVTETVEVPATPAVVRLMGGADSEKS